MFWPPAAHINLAPSIAEQAAVPGSSRPLMQSQKLSFTLWQGIVLLCAPPHENDPAVHSNDHCTVCRPHACAELERGCSSGTFAAVLAPVHGANSAPAWDAPLWSGMCAVTLQHAACMPQAAAPAGT